MPNYPLQLYDFVATFTLSLLELSREKTSMVFFLTHLPFYSHYALEQ